MRITRPLNKVLDSEAKIRVLRFLCETNAEWNGRQIAKEIGVTPATAHKALNGLKDEGVLFMKNMGKTHVYSLEKNYLVEEILKPLFSRESEIYGHIMRIIHREISKADIKSEILTVLLFGSVNVKQDHQLSDIDIAVIVKAKNAKTKVELLFEKIDEEVSEMFGTAVSVYVNTITEFKTKKKEDMKVIKNILKNHTVLYGEKLEVLI
jgi:predicted nucleotidyltransferase